MKNFYLTFLLFTYFNASCQEIKTAVVVDSAYKKPISFANASFYFTNIPQKGDYSNELGILKIPANSNKVIISCQSYEEKVIDNFRDTIFLKQIPINLKEIIIDSKSKHITLGLINEKKMLSIGGSKGIETVIFIENLEREEKTIKSFLFNVKRKDKYLTAVRFHLYKKHENKFQPGEEIMQHDIVKLINGKTKGEISIDLSTFGLTIPVEGIFAGIELLGILDEKTGEFIDGSSKWNDTAIDYNYSVNKSITFMRDRFKSNIWDNSERLKKDLSNIKSENYPNASFGITVYK